MLKVFCDPARRCFPPTAESARMMPKAWRTVRVWPNFSLLTPISSAAVIQPSPCAAQLNKRRSVRRGRDLNTFCNPSTKRAAPGGRQPDIDKRQSAAPQAISSKFICLAGALPRSMPSPCPGQCLRCDATARCLCSSLLQLAPWLPCMPVRPTGNH